MTCLHLTLITITIGLRDIEAIQLLQDLIKLNLSKNQIVEISALSALVKLSELNLAENHM